MARWPGKIAPGRVSDHLGYFPDVLPTIAEATGAKPPADIDGISILPALLERKPIAHPPLYWEFHERGFDQAARIDEWKAVRIGGVNAPLELYDLKQDPGEKRNVAAENPEVIARFEKFLRSARIDSALWPIREKPAGKKPRAQPATRADSSPFFKQTVSDQKF
jgi:arylsulfatase A-like enzyme